MQTAKVDGDIDNLNIDIIKAIDLDRAKETENSRKNRIFAPAIVIASLVEL